MNQAKFAWFVWWICREVPLGCCRYVRTCSTPLGGSAQAPRGGWVRMYRWREKGGRYSLEGQLFVATPKVRLFGAWENSAEMTVLNKEVPQHGSYPLVLYSKRLRWVVGAFAPGDWPK